MTKTGRHLCIWDSNVKVKVAYSVWTLLQYENSKKIFTLHGAIFDNHPVLYRNNSSKYITSKPRIYVQYWLRMFLTTLEREDGHTRPGLICNDVIWSRIFIIVCCLTSELNWESRENICLDKFDTFANFSILAFPPPQQSEFKLRKQQLCKTRFEFIE